MADYILYLSIRFLAALLRLLPLSLSLFIGRRFGDLLYYALGRRKSVAYANLKSAFGGRYGPAELRRIIRKQCQSLSQSFIEVVKFPLLGEGYVKKYIRVEGEDKITAALRKGRGAILLTAHFGNWELSSLVGAIKGYKMNVLARWQKFERLNGYLNRMRSIRGARVIYKDDARERVEEALKNNEVVGILSDQDGGKRGEFVEFFGRLASTPKGVAHFSLKTGAQILPVFIVRESGPYHRIIVEDDISAAPSAEMSRDIHEVLQRFARLLEGYVERWPGQWLWLHKRWKSTPTRKVLVLSDGKAGHLKQSLTVADMIRRRRLEAGCADAETKVKTLEVRFRNIFYRRAFDAFSFLGFDLYELSFCFAPETFEGLKSEYADIVISCGSSLAGVNLSLKKELNAKSVVIMQPGIYKLRRYDLVLIPAHDLRGRVAAYSCAAPHPRRRNVVVVRGALAGFDRASLERCGEALKAKFDIRRANVIGVLIGGDSKAHVLDARFVDSVLEDILSAAEELDADMLVTTSRRTPPSVERVVRERLGGRERVKLLLIANERNFEGAVEAILGASDVLVVSGESVTMVSEAVSSGRSVIVFMPQRKKGILKSKQELSVEDFKAQGCLVLSGPGRLSGDIRDSVGNGRRKEMASAMAERVRLAIGGLL